MLEIANDFLSSHILTTSTAVVLTVLLSINIRVLYRYCQDTPSEATEDMTDPVESTCSIRIVRTQAMCCVTAGAAYLQLCC